MADLYDAVGHGMWAYSNAAFRVDVLGGEKPDPGPGTLVAVTHRKETDVPVIGPPLYFAMGGRRNTTGRMHFAARDDMFVPGFFAGFPPDLPLRARRLLYRVGVGPWLPRVNVFPIRSASVARVGEVLAAAPDRPLGELLPGGGRRRRSGRARGRGGLAPPGARRRRPPGRLRRPALAAALARGHAGPGGVLEPPRRAGGRRLPDAGRDRPRRERPHRLPRGPAVAGRGDRADQAGHRRARPPRQAAGDPPARASPTTRSSAGAPASTSPSASRSSRRRRTSRARSSPAPARDDAAHVRPGRRRAARRPARRPTSRRWSATSATPSPSPVRKGARSSPTSATADGRRRRLTEALVGGAAPGGRPAVPRARARERPRG